MHMKGHPLEKTATDIRRSISRLENLVINTRHTTPEELEKAREVLRLLREAHEQIPDEFRDTDLVKR